MFADVDHAGSPAELVETAEVVEGVAALPTERLEAEIRQMAAHLAAAMCRWLLLVAEYDRRRAWESWECLSCAHWVSWICGISMSTAHEHVRVARAIETLPLVPPRPNPRSSGASPGSGTTTVASPVGSISGPMRAMC